MCGDDSFYRFGIREGFLDGLPIQELLLLLSCFSRVRLWVTLWTVAHQAPLSTGFSRQEYRSGLPFPSPNTGDMDSMILPSFLHFNETCSVKCLLVSLLFYGLKQHLFCSPVWNLGRAWRKTWQCTPVFLPGKILWTEEPGGLQSTGSQESYMTQRLNHHQWGQLVDTAPWSACRHSISCDGSKAGAEII